jgi:hypothetical protein
MPVIDRLRPEDCNAAAALYRRVFGPDAAASSLLRWEWQYRFNPNSPGPEPMIWVAREGPSIVGQHATMPVRLWVHGRHIDASWGIDVMVAPERQRQGLGEILFGTWESNVGAALGIGLSPSSRRLFEKLRWPRLGPIPCLVKPLSRRAVKRVEWPDPVNRVVSAVTLPYIRRVARPRPLGHHVEVIQQFDADFDELWERIAPKLDLAVRRDAAYLQWKYLAPPHVRYTVAALFDDGKPLGYVVYRHTREARSRVTLLVDFLVDPDDAAVFETLLAWVDREAVAADSDKIRCHSLHAGFRRILRRSGYFVRRSTLDFVVKINALPLSDSFYRDTDRWHITFGDADLDR